MPKEAIVLAGGLGTRLKEITKDIPKPMVDINGRPFLEYLLDYLQKQGVQKVVLSVGYKWEIIHRYFGDKFKDINIDYSIEDEPLGTGGAIKLAIQKTINNDVYILNGDTYFDVNLPSLYAFHKEKNSPLTISLKPMINFDRYGSIEIDTDGKILSFSEKKYKDYGLINGGVYLLNIDFFKSLKLPDKFSFEKDFLEVYYKQNSFFGKIFDSYFIDIGIPQDYEKAKRDFKRFEDR